MSILLALAFLAGTIIARAAGPASTEISGVVSDPRGAVVAGLMSPSPTRTPVHATAKTTAPAPTPSSRSSRHLHRDSRGRRLKSAKVTNVSPRLLSPPSSLKLVVVPVRPSPSPPKALTSSIPPPRSLRNRQPKACQYLPVNGRDFRTSSPDSRYGKPTVSRYLCQWPKSAVLRAGRLTDRQRRSLSLTSGVFLGGNATQRTTYPSMARTSSLRTKARPSSCSLRQTSRCSRGKWCHECRVRLRHRRHQHRYKVGTNQFHASSMNTSVTTVSMRPITLPVQ